MTARRLTLTVTSDEWPRDYNDGKTPCKRCGIRRQVQWKRLSPGEAYYCHDCKSVMGIAYHASRQEEEE